MQKLILGFLFAIALILFSCENIRFKRANKDFDGIWNIAAIEVGSRLSPGGTPLPDTTLREGLGAIQFDFCETYDQGGCPMFLLSESGMSYEGSYQVTINNASENEELSLTGWLTPTNQLLGTFDYTFSKAGDTLTITPLNASISPAVDKGKMEGLVLVQ